MSPNIRSDQSANRSQEMILIVHHIANGEDFGSYKAMWEAYITALAISGGHIDVNVLVQQVLRESYLETNKDLQFYAEKVKYFNESKKQIRDYLQQLQDHRKIIEDQSAKLELELQSLDGNTNLEQLRLQNVLEKQQKVLETSTNISKQLHDTATAVIKNLK
jgi:hypothetical protein